MNSLGQNILHIATKHGQDIMVKSILLNPMFEKLLNEIDENGHIALHLASINFHSNVTCSLTWDKRVNFSYLNKECLTALDIVWQNELIMRQV